LSRCELKLKSDRIVTIKPIAYYKMLVHILRYGNKERDPRQYREVMGMLIGYLEGDGDIKDVVITEAVPISHGGSIEVEFKPHDYISFAVVDEQFAEKNWFTVGWYHSHPGLKIFWSSTDVKNQLGWQTANPSAIGIVFDHTYLEKVGDLGFRTFRLDNPMKGVNYHEVKTIVEPPDNNEYYFEIMTLINKIHSKEPVILELNETPDPFGEIIFPEKNDLLPRKPELQLNTLFSALQNGISKLLQLSVEPLISFLNGWSQQIIKKTAENNLEMRKNLMAIKDTLSQGIDSLQNSLKFSLMNKLNEVDIYIDDKFESFDEDHEKIKALIKSTKEELINQIDTLFEEKIKIIYSKSLNSFDQVSTELININEKSITSSQKIEQQLKSLENVFKNVNSIEKSTSENLERINKKIFENFKEKVNQISNSFKELAKNANSFLDELDKSISLLEKSKQSLKNKINQNLETNQKLKEEIEQVKNDNNALKVQLENSKGENKDLLKQIKKLEKNGG